MARCTCPMRSTVILTKTRTNASGIELSSDQRRRGAGSMIAAASTFKSAFALLETTPRRCACLSPVVPGAACRLCAICFLFSQLVGDLAAVLRELLHHLLAVNHHPLGILFPLSTLKPFSSRRFCVPHMSAASGAKPASSSFVQSVAIALVLRRHADAKIPRWQSEGGRPRG